MSLIRVLGDRVLVALAPKEAHVVQSSGLVLVKDPELRVETRGIVAAIGEKKGTVALDDVIATWDECERHLRTDWRGALDELRPAPFDVKVGDCVLIPAWAGDAIEDDHLRYVILKEADIIAVLEPLPKETEAA